MKTMYSEHKMDNDAAESSDGNASPSNKGMMIAFAILKLF